MRWPPTGAFLQCIRDNERLLDKFTDLDTNLTTIV